MNSMFIDILTADVIVQVIQSNSEVCPSTQVPNYLKSNKSANSISCDVPPPSITALTRCRLIDTTVPNPFTGDNIISCRYIPFDERFIHRLDVFILTLFVPAGGVRRYTLFCTTDSSLDGTRLPLS